MSRVARRGAATSVASVPAALPALVVAGGAAAFASRVEVLAGLAVLLAAGLATVVALLVRSRRHLAAVRARAERALADQRADAERLRTLAENSPEVVARFDRRLRHTYVNGYGARVYGRRPEEVIGKTNADLGMPPDKVAYWREQFEQVFATKRQRTVDFEFDGPLGHQHFSSLFVPEFDERGEVASILAITRDVSELRRAERTLRDERDFMAAVLDVAASVVVVFDSDGRLVRSNRACEVATGYAADELREMRYGDFVPAEERSGVDRTWRQLAMGAFPNRHVNHWRRQDGTLVLIAWSNTAIADEAGNVRYVVGTGIDITEQKRAEEAVREADRRKTEFLAMLSHELRNPLAPIRNSLYILERAEPGGAQARRAHEVIARQVDHLARLVDDLLDVTRITRGKVRLQREPVELCGLVRRVAEDHRTVFVERGVTLAFDESCPGPLVADGDPTRLAQVIGNLLANAAKFTPRGGRVSIALEATSGTAAVRIRDTGAGIPAGVIERLFEPFVQADATLDRSKGGLGLGLALVKGLVELHGGTVVARSDGTGKGAEFTFTLPLAADKAAPVPAVAAPAAVGRTAALRVLVIEDNTDAAESLKEALEFGGHYVALASSGPAGLATARTFRPQVVLCDIGLPGLNGYEVARSFRADPALRPTPLIALSGYAQPEDLERSREAGFLRHLAKPPDLDALERTLAEVGARAGETIV